MPMFIGFSRIMDSADCNSAMAFQGLTQKYFLLVTFLTGDGTGLLYLFTAT